MPDVNGQSQILERWGGLEASQYSPSTMKGHIDVTALKQMLSTKLGPLISLTLIKVDHDVTDNDKSDMSRIQAKVVTESGEEEMSLLVKNSVYQDFEDEGLNELASLALEIKIYNDVLPKMEKLMTKMGLKNEILWAHCLGNLDSTLVLEDLQVYGYTIGDRFEGLDHRHTSMVVQRLAQFHALSAVMKNTGDINVSDYSKFLFDGNFENVNCFITSGSQYLHRIASREWTPEWEVVIKNVDRISKVAVNKLSEITKLQQGGFHVLNHGDIWVNNIMFKHKNKLPVSVRFIDYQLCHYNSYAFDLHYFMNTSVSTEVLYHFDRVYDEYHHHLTTELAKFGITGPSLKELYLELRRTEFFGLFSAMSFAPIVMGKQDLPSQKHPRIMKEDLYRTDDYTKKIQVILRQAQHGGLFDRLYA